MQCLERLESAVRRVRIVLATRLGLRKTGLMKLRHEIRACEYEDVHVMWELLRRKGNDVGGYSPLTTTTTMQRRGTRSVWSVFRSRAPYRLCSSF